MLTSLLTILSCTLVDGCEAYACTYGQVFSILGMSDAASCLCILA